MARPIMDSIVLERCTELGIDPDLIKEDIPIGVVHVKEELEKVKLEKSPLGIPEERSLNSLKNKYEAIIIDGDECFVEIGNLKRPVSKNTLRMIKALGLEQVSGSVIYSRAVALCFTQLLKQALSNNITGDFLPQDTDNLTSHQIKIITLIETYVKKEIVK